MPAQFNKTRSVEDLKLAIAYNGKSGQPPQECSWIELDRNHFTWRVPPTAVNSIRAKPITCPLLMSLVMLYKASDGFKCRYILPNAKVGEIPSCYVPGVLAAYDACCANLTANCWHNKLMRIRGVIASAAEAGGYLSMG